MRVLVIGAAGLQGSRLTKILDRRAWVSHLTLADKDVSRCAQVASEVEEKPSETVEIDIADHAALVGLMKRADVV